MRVIHTSDWHLGKELPKHLLDADRVHLIGGMPRYDGQSIVERTLIKLRDETGTPRMICAAVPYLHPVDLPIVGGGESPLKTLYREVIKAANILHGGLPLIVTGHLHLISGAVSEQATDYHRRRGSSPCRHLPSKRRLCGLGPPPQAPIYLGSNGHPLCRITLPDVGTEKDYQHSIVVIDIDKMKGVKTDLVPTPRPVAFHRVPAVGAAPLDMIEDEFAVLSPTVLVSIAGHSWKLPSSSMGPSPNSGDGLMQP